MSDWASWGKRINREWRDRVAGVDEPLTSAADVAHDSIDEAIEFAETMLECVMPPLRDMLATFPSIMAQGGSRRRASTASDDWD